jgi:hypothetical protein
VSDFFDDAFLDLRANRCEKKVEMTVGVVATATEGVPNCGIGVGIVEDANVLIPVTFS